MARGPLPKPGAVRRNEPTIPGTVLPPGGRKGRAPAVPKGYKLGPAGKAWWAWAWKLPQATAWDKGSLYFAARRAVLEDDLAAIDNFNGLDLADLLGAGPDEVRELVTLTLKSLRSQASGKASLMKEMRELENRLGLNPKALSDLRWTIKAPEAEAEKAKAKPSARRAHLRAV